MKYDLPTGYVLAEDKLQMPFSTTLPMDKTLMRCTAVNLDNGNPSVVWTRESGHAGYKLIK